MSAKLDHIGHIVKNLDDGMKLYKKLGWTTREGSFMQVPEFGARMVFYPLGGVEIELIEPGSLEGDPATRCLKERGEGLFHLSIIVDDYDAEVKTLREKGFTVVEHTHEAPGHTVRLAFLAPEETHGLWIEFIDSASRPPRDKIKSSY